MTLHDGNHASTHFVAHVPETIFDNDPDDALGSVHDVLRQVAVECGVFTYDRALAKVASVTDLGHHDQFALRCVPTIPSAEREGAHAELLT